MDCKDCPYVVELQRRLETEEHKSDDYEKRITKLERKTDVERERTDMVFKILNEIKGSIDKTLV